MPIVYDGRGCLHSGKLLDNAVNFLKGQNYSIDFSKQSLYDNDYQKSHWGVSWMIICDGLKGSYLDLFITTFKVKNMLKERLHWIDIMRGMAMLFVVMQHMSAYLYYDYLYYKFITIVDIGIFFFVSGYILDKVVCLNSFYEVLIFILKKTIQLMVPFFVWGVIAKHYFFAVSPSAITFEDLISQWTAPTLWFLLTLYGYMYYFAVNKWLCTKRLKFVSIIFSIGAFVLLFILWHISGEFKLATLYFPFFAGGVLLSLFKREEMLKNSILRGLSVLAVIFLTALWKSGGQSFFYVGIKYIVSTSAIVILYSSFGFRIQAV